MSYVFASGLVLWLKKTVREKIAGVNFYAYICRPINYNLFFMNNQTKILLASAILFSAPLARAESEIEVKAPDDGPTVTAPLRVGTVLTLKTDGIEIANEGESLVSLPYSQVMTISFNTEKVGVGRVEAASPLSLRRNPVESRLEIAGHDGSAAQLRVTSLAGQLAVSLDAWKGEPVDVTHLTPGVYILNINNQTLKFIKK